MTGLKSRVSTEQEGDGGAGCPGALGQSHMSGERPWRTGERHWVPLRVGVTRQNCTARWALDRDVEKGCARPRIEQWAKRWKAGKDWAKLTGSLSPNWLRIGQPPLEGMRLKILQPPQKWPGYKLASTLAGQQRRMLHFVQAGKAPTCERPSV